MNITTGLFSLEHTFAARLLQNFPRPWEALAGLNGFIYAVGEGLDGEEFLRIADGVWVHKSAYVSPSAVLLPPCVVCAGTQVRRGAYVRGSALVGENCVVGNSVELKNAILSDGVQVPHFNYVGDSILGFKAHMGAGAVISNVKSDKSPVRVSYGGENFQTSLKKLGAMIGDFAELGCNSVLCPGAVVGKNSTVYPLTCVRGEIPSDSIYKGGGELVSKR